ncbi:MAG: endonuclease [Capnocytophaga sp.]|nr:endonuclease [Capnocytophaga sp.]
MKIPPKLLYYYQSIDFSKKQADLKGDLATLTIAKHTNILMYKERHPYLQNADADSKNPSNVVLIYTGESRPKANIWKGSKEGSINTEHVYPQSFLGEKNNPKNNQPKTGDLHHLRYCDSSVNSSRSNHPYTEGSGEAHKVGKNSWYPGDEWKGDVARMVLYLNLRYNLPTEKVSTKGIGLFLKWNAEDRVSDFEKQRNDEIEKAQGNRNPFIDNPYLASKIYGEVEGYSPENTWK